MFLLTAQYFRFAVSSVCSDFAVSARVRDPVNEFGDMDVFISIHADNKEPTYVHIASII